MEEYLFLYDLGAVHASSLGNWHHGMTTEGFAKLETENATTRELRLKLSELRLKLSDLRLHKNG
jgi:hypothetical protein